MAAPLGQTSRRSSTASSKEYQARSSINWFGTTAPNFTASREVRQSGPIREAKISLNTLIAIFLLLAWSFDAYSAAAPGGRPPLTKVRVSQSAVNTRSAVLWIAKGQGFFAKHGLDVETIYLRSSNLQMAAMATGDVQFGSSGGA